MRFSRMFDADGGYTEQEPAEGRGVDLSTGQPAGPSGPDPVAAPAAPEAPPTSDPGPGPAPRPAPQGGNPPAPQPPPPAVVSSVPGIEASEATGGVQGSFGQAGSAGFSKRFGLPAAWFKGGPTAGLAREAGNRGREVLGRERAGQVSGGYGAETVGNVAGPSTGGEGGGKNDEEWQRILQAAMRNRFQK